MAIILEGNITNKVISGANGDFSVGSFHCDLGKFKIKDPLLDQFDEGEYRVRVAVQHLDIKSFASQRNGIIITEIVADIDAIEVIDAEIKPVEAEQIEPDASVVETKQPSATPAVETGSGNKPSRQQPAGVTGQKHQPAAKPEKKPAARPKPDSTAATATASASDSDLPELFGHLWPLGQQVKLDTTLPRATIIRQKQHLVAEGYSFDARTQTWSK